MVYTGKPSRACATCKKRRIKCDEARPACGQCVKSKRECTGYKSEAELMFRDETKATAKRAERSRKSKSVSPDENYSGGASVDFGETMENSMPTSPGYGEEAVDISGQVSRLSPPVAPGSSLSRSMTPVYLEMAKGYFFNQFILPRENHGFNHFQLIHDMYIASPPDDTITKTTEALSLLTLSRQPAHRFLRPQAAKAYGVAVQSVANAVADPIKMKEDATLMSITMLSFAETLDLNSSGRPEARHLYKITPKEKGIVKFHQAWGAHAYGAQCIIQIRGAGNMAKSSVSLPLLIYSRFQAIIRHIFNSEPVKDFDQIWQPELEQQATMDVFSPQIEIAGIGLRIPTLRFRALHALRRPMTPGLGDILSQILSDTKMMDYELVEWAYKYRTRRPESVAGYHIPESGLDMSEEKAYPGPVFTYDGLAAMNSWNIYRTYRIFVQMIIFNLLERLVPPDIIETHPDFIACKEIMQTLADGVCATIPFAVGYLHTLPLSPTPHPNELGKFVSPGLLSRFTGDFLAAERQQDFMRQGERRSHIDSEHGPAISAWYIIWPLHVAQCALPVDLSTKEWIKGRFGYIGEAFGIEQANVYIDRGYKRYKPGVRRQEVTPFDFAPLPWEPLQ